MAGYYKMHRGWLKHPVLKDRFCRAAAWAWLIDEAAWKPYRKLIAGQMVDLDRGQLSHSLRFIAEAWGWKKDAVARFIARLETETMIATSNATGQIVITICNYDIYQSQEDETATTNETDTATAARQQRDSSATNEKKINNTKKEIDSPQLTLGTPLPPLPRYTTEFEIFWDAYPRKVDKDRAASKFREACRSATASEILKGLKAYRFSGEAKFIPHAATWLHNRRWIPEVNARGAVDDDDSNSWLGTP